MEVLPTSFGTFLRFAKSHSLVRALLRDLSLAVLPAPASFTELEADDTAHAFFSRHFSMRLASRFVSSLMHGVYSGRSRTLLTSRVFRYLWQLEAAYGSVVVGALVDPWLRLTAHQDAKEFRTPQSPTGRGRPPAIVRAAKKERIVSFRTGMHELTAGLEQAVREFGVKVRLGSEVEAIDGVWSPGATAKDPSTISSLSVVCTDGSAHPADLVISTLPEGPLSSVLEVRPPPRLQQHPLPLPPSLRPLLRVSLRCGAPLPASPPYESQPRRDATRRCRVPRAVA